MPFTNRNVCKTFQLTANGSLQSFATQECSEVIVCPVSDILVYDHQNPTVGFKVVGGKEFIFRGLVNSNQLSATGSGIVYYRTQYFSYLPGV